MKPVFVIFVLMLLTGCAGGWVKVDDAGRTYKGEHYSSKLPTGWMRIESGDGLVVSRDGILLQYISILYKPHKNAFETIEKDSSADMLPSELAELTIAEIKAAEDEGLPSLEILSNAPVELAGRTGVGLHIRYKTTDGLRMEMLLSGVVDESGFYLVKYSAPTLHYFERDREAYEDVVASLQL